MAKELMSSEGIDFFSESLLTGIIDGSVSGLIEGAMSWVGPGGAQMLIDHDKYVLSVVLNALFGDLEYPDGISGEEMARLEGMRDSLGRKVLQVMGMVRTFASRFPEEAVRAKVTPEWLIRRGERGFPEVVEVWRRNGERGRLWLRNQSEEIADYLTG